MAILGRMLPGRALTVTMGDQAVFEAVVAALGLPIGWQRRLIRAFGEQEQLEPLMLRLASPAPVQGLGPEIEVLLASGNED
eukprot:gene2682-biopygen2254